MSKILSEPENICICETEQNLLIILKNIEERRQVLKDLELFFESLIEMMKKYVFMGEQKFCYQWIYALKTKEIVEKIKELNTFLRMFQKNNLTQEKTIKFIDDVLILEKNNFDNVVNIFNIKMNFLKNFENGNSNINEKFKNKEKNRVDNSFFEFEIKKRIKFSQDKLEGLEKQLSELICVQIDTRKKLHFKILEIKPTTF